MDGLEEEEAENHVKKVAAGGSSAKALDPCLETGEVGEGPARPAKVVEKVGEVVDKVEEPQEAEEKPLLLSKLSRPLLDDLEVEKGRNFSSKGRSKTLDVFRPKKLLTKLTGGRKRRNFSSKY